MSFLNVCQIHAECKRFGKAYSLRSVAVYGGGSMWEQAKALQEGAEIVVCTPVRERNNQLLSDLPLQEENSHSLQLRDFLLMCVTGSSD